MTSKAQYIHEPGNSEVRIIRTVNFPRELVFRAWTDPSLIDNWWGPDGYTTSTHEIDVRPGGIWRYDMSHAEHGSFANRIIYDEITPPERLVYRHGDDVEDMEENYFLVVVNFIDEGNGRTTLNTWIRFKSEAVRDQLIREFGILKGNEQTIDRMEAELSKLV